MLQNTILDTTHSLTGNESIPTRNTQISNFFTSLPTCIIFMDFLWNIHYKVYEVVLPFIFLMTCEMILLLCAYCFICISFLAKWLFKFLTHFNILWILIIFLARNLYIFSFICGLSFHSLNSVVGCTNIFNID